MVVNVEIRPGEWVTWRGPPDVLLMRARKLFKAVRVARSAMRKLAERFEYVADPDERWQHPLTTIRTGKGDCEDWYFVCVAAGFSGFQLSRRRGGSRHVRPQDVPDIAGMVQLGMQARETLGFNPFARIRKATAKAARYMAKQVKRHGPKVLSIAAKNPFLAPTLTMIPELAKRMPELRSVARAIGQGAVRIAPTVAKAAAFHPALAPFAPFASLLTQAKRTPAPLPALPPLDPQITQLAQLVRDPRIAQFVQLLAQGR